MVGTVENSDPSAARTEENRRALHSMRTQRLRLIGSAIAFIAMSAALSTTEIRDVTVAVLSVPAVVALILSVVRSTHAFYPRIIVPVTVAVTFGASIIAHTLIQPAPDALRYGALFLVLGALLCGIAPTRRAIITSAIAMAIVEGTGAVMLEVHTGTFASADAAVMLVIAVALPLFVSDILDDARLDAGAMRAELSRRATSDEISGVSNRAHISLLAQNEFSRARRYGEPYSCLMIEIEAFDALLASHGRAGGHERNRAGVYRLLRGGDAPLRQLRPPYPKPLPRVAARDAGHRRHHFGKPHVPRSRRDKCRVRGRRVEFHGQHRRYGDARRRPLGRGYVATCRAGPSRCPGAGWELRGVRCAAAASAR